MQRSNRCCECRCWVAWVRSMNPLRHASLPPSHIWPVWPLRSGRRMSPGPLRSWSWRSRTTRLEKLDGRPGRGDREEVARKGTFNVPVRPAADARSSSLGGRIQSTGVGCFCRRERSNASRSIATPEMSSRHGSTRRPGDVASAVTPGMAPSTCWTSYRLGTGRPRFLARGTDGRASCGGKHRP